MRSRSLASLAAVALVVLTCVVSHAKKADWDVEGSLGPSRTVSFTTDEGTWMNVDVSPDGKQIAFDMLGDIYVMPIKGGTATLLRGGAAFEVQPRFSPDGKYISYTSDKGGGDNVWVMDRDGENPRQVTKEDFRLINNAVWSPDGEYLLAKKHFTSTRSLGAGEIWLYHVSGGSGIQLTKRKNDQQDVGEPSASPDGRYVYFSEDMTPGPRFQYNKDPYAGIYDIRRVDRSNGKVETVVRGPGGAVRPQVSPDGTKVAFVRRVRLESVLFIHNLETGENYPVFDGLTKDQQETWATFGVYPNFAWMPDGKDIVFYAKGKIWRVNIASRAVTNIPFSVNASHTVYEPLRFPQEVSPDTFDAKMIKHTTTSPDGNWLFFSAVGQIWKKRLPNGTPERLTKDKDNWEYWPTFSPDGKYLVYVTFNETDLGAIYRIKPNGSGKKKLTSRPGYYHNPSFSPDGSKVVYQRGGGDNVLGFRHAVDPGLYWLPSNGGESTRIREGGRSARFSADGERIYFVDNVAGRKKAFKSVRLDGGDEVTLLTSQYANRFEPSPDGKWLAFNELFHAYVIPFPIAGREYSLSGKTKSVPIKKVTRDSGTYLHWSSDSEQLCWTLGDEYFTRNLKDCFDWVPGAPDSILPPDTAGVRIGLTLTTDKPKGKIALTNARVITMNGDEVIENGAVLIEDNRIVAVGQLAAMTIPAGEYTEVDCSGKTIMPGLIDVHAHMWHSSSGISPQQSWLYFANLAFGVTTTHDPSNQTESVFTHSEMLKSGRLIGPRVYSTGTILYGADGDFKALTNGIDDAASHLRRMKAVGAFSVKSYNQPRRNQRQQYIKAARDLEMMVVPEGGSFFYHNMTMILDGHTGIEHTLPIAPIYNDVKTLWGQSDVGSTPTLVVGYGGIWGENYWYQKTNVWEHDRLLTFVPRPLVDARSRRRMMIADDDFNHFALAKNCKDLIDAGGKVQLGAHGQLQGLAAHWELWMFAQGGMTNHEALRCATLYGAEYIGLDGDVGSLQPGKLADLIVLDKNPLDDIRNSEFIKYTMINGRLFDAATMNEVGNYNRKRNPFYWEHPGANDAFVWQPGLGFQTNHCGCFNAH